MIKKFNIVKYLKKKTINVIYYIDRERETLYNYLREKLLKFNKYLQY